jgi:hypothetical protein
MKPILQQAIHLRFKSSYIILGLLVVISIVSCLVIVILPLLLIFKLLLILCVIASSVYFILRDALLMLPSSWRFLDIDTKGQLTITNQSNQSFQPILADSSFIHSRMILLNFKREGFKLALPSAIFFPQDKNADGLRHLRVWLRWGKPSKQHQEDLAEVIG